VYQVLGNSIFEMPAAQLPEGIIAIDPSSYKHYDITLRPQFHESTKWFGDSRTVDC